MKHLFGLGLLLAATPAAAADPQGWFAPAAPKSGSTVDMTTHVGKDDVVVIAKRPHRTWRTQPVEQLNDPLASDAARPRQSFANARPYCNSTLRTVGGQPGNASDMMTGLGAGGC